MELLGLLIWLWLIYAFIAGVFAAPIIFFGRKRIHFQRWELLVIILPFVAWAILMFSDLSTGKKSLANLAEPFYFAWAVPLAALIRVWVGQKAPDRLSATILITAVCIIAILSFFLIPPLPE